MPATSSSDPGSDFSGSSEEEVNLTTRETLEKLAKAARAKASSYLDDAKAQEDIIKADEDLYSNGMTKLNVTLEYLSTRPMLLASAQNMTLNPHRPIDLTWYKALGGDATAEETLRAEEGVRKVALTLQKMPEIEDGLRRLASEIEEEKKELKKMREKAKKATKEAEKYEAQLASGSQAFRA